MILFRVFGYTEFVETIEENEMYYTLLDAVAMNRMYPDTFLIPGDELINRIKSGDFVKLGFIPTPAAARKFGAEHTERMWVKVTEIDAPRGESTPMLLSGTLSNAPFEFAGVLEFGDPVSFAAWNIMTIEFGETE